MTPGIDAVKKSGISYKVHEYIHDPDNAAFGVEAAEKLGVAEHLVFKTLLVSLDGKRLAVAIVPVSHRLNMKLFARAAGAKKAEMAAGADVERSTGYVLGGVSPLGQKKKLATIIHASAADCQTVFISAGRRGLEIELQPDDLLRLTNGVYAELCMQS